MDSRKMGPTQETALLNDVTDPDHDPIPETPLRGTRGGIFGGGNPPEAIKALEEDAPIHKDVAQNLSSHLRPESRR